MFVTSKTVATALEENNLNGKIYLKINICFSLTKYNSFLLCSGDLPVAPKCTFNFSHVGAFSAEWNGVAYKTLKTCSKSKSIFTGCFRIKKQKRKTNFYNKKFQFFV